MADSDEEPCDACIDGERARAESLLDEGANIEHPCGERGCTPIILASEAGHLDVVKMLHGRSANVNFQATHGENALMAAAIEGHAAVATFLVTECGADVNAVENEGYSALHLAADGGFLDIVKMLQGHGANLHALTNDEENALMLAARGGRLDIVTYLAGQGVDIRVRNNLGVNALMAAACSGHAAVATFLVTECGADVSAVDNDGFSALHLAADGGFLDIVKMLQTHGANLHAFAFNSRGMNALMLAAHFGRLDIVTYLAGQGVDIHALANDEENALMLAADSGHLHVVEWLADQGVDVNAQDYEGASALHMAAEEGFLCVVKMLHSHEANLHALTDRGDNALTLAAYRDRPDVCTYLISLGLNPALKDEEEESALTHYAQWLDEDHPDRDEFEESPPLSDEEKHARVKLLTDARAEYLELQRREECYQRRKNAITFLQGSGFLLTTAQREARKAEEAQVDTHAKLAAIDRSTKEANLKYLTDRVFGEDKGRHLGREIVMML